jgi:Glutaminase
MAGTLANGGVNPVTKKVCVSAETVKYVLPVMATQVCMTIQVSGFMQRCTGKIRSGWWYHCCSSRQVWNCSYLSSINTCGNSAKAIQTIKYIIEQLGVNPYQITPKK